MSWLITGNEGKGADAVIQHVFDTYGAERWDSRGRVYLYP